MINQFEYDVLCNWRRAGYRWIVRDKLNGLSLHREKPKNVNGYWQSDKFGNFYIGKFEEFTMIKKSESPTKILDLIHDYEKHLIVKGE